MLVSVTQCWCLSPHLLCVLSLGPQGTGGQSGPEGDPGETGPPVRVSVYTLNSPMYGYGRPPSWFVDTIISFMYGSDRPTPLLYG